MKYSLQSIIIICFAIGLKSIASCLESNFITGAPADLHPLLGLDTIVVKKKVMIINTSSDHIDHHEINPHHINPHHIDHHHFDHHQIEMVEVVMGCETKNRYHIFDDQVSTFFRKDSRKKNHIYLILRRGRFFEQRRRLIGAQGFPFPLPPS